MSDTDLELLARYGRRHDEDAFAEIVRRHLNLVYSAALRQVRSPQLAEEVAQSAFTDLAHNAARLKRDTILTAWLYQVTRRTAIDVVRRESRRQLREQIATEMNAMNATTDDWTQIEPLLDDAMAALDQTDRAAVLLRFFENKSLREVGERLGASEDAARKRISRAVERLREFFVKRGVTVGASGLVAVISANAVQAAPAGLASILTTASLAAGTTGAGILSTLTNTLIMTKTTATILTVVAAGAIVVPLALKQRHTPEPIPAASPPPTPIVPPVQESSTEPRLAAPTARPTTAPARAPSQTLLARVHALRPLTPAQIEKYVEQNRRNAESLLAAYRIGSNLAYLTEAATRFPNNPDVQYAVIAARPDQKIQREWIEAYKSSSPDNALAWYFSALEYFKTGESALAIKELAEATQKPAFRAELAPTLQAVEELNLSAGRAADEAKIAAFQDCVSVPHLTQMGDLAKLVLTTAQQYRQQGDTASAESLAGMGLMLGRHLSAGGGSQTLIYQLVGISIEKKFLQLLDPNGNDPFGRPVADVSAAIAQQEATLKETAKTLTPLVSRLDDAEVANYMERVKLYGEEAALTWLKAKHEKP